MRTRAFAALLRAAWSEYERDYARYFATAMVYYALVSLVPLLLLLLSLLGLLLRLSDVAAATEQQVLEAVDTRFGGELRAGLEMMLERLQQQSIVGTAAGFVGLLVAASALFRQLRLSFRAIWKHPPPLLSGSVLAVLRRTVVERVIAFGLVLLGGAVLAASLASVAALQWLGASARPQILENIWQIALLGPLAAGLVTFAVLFKVLPPARVAWRDVGLAAVLCTAVWTIGSDIVAVSAGALGSGLGAYGALGAVLVVMLWMNAISKLVFFGAELCKVSSERGPLAAPYTPTNRLWSVGAGRSEHSS